MKLTEQLARKVPTEDEELLPHEPIVIPDAREYLLGMVPELAAQAKAIVQAAEDDNWRELTPEEDARIKTLVGKIADLRWQAGRLQERTEA